MMRIRPAHALGLAGAAFLCLSPALAAQSFADFGPRPARWSLELDVGGRLPGTLYDHFIERRYHEQAGPLRTRWREETDLGYETRLTVRHRPEAGLGLYLSGLLGRSGTTAFFSGALVPPQAIDRSLTYTGLEGGVSMKLRDWAGGRGLVDYHVGAVLHRQVLDLSPGHRDALAFFGTGPPPSFQWDSRALVGWGLSLGTSVRIPVGEDYNLRVQFRDMLVPVNTLSYAQQEEEDIRAFTGERARIYLRPYTAHHMSLSVGLEYTFGWGQPRREVIRQIPVSAMEAELAPAVANAMRLAAQGDTAAAAAALEHRVEVDPRDAYAWRELALLRSARAEIDPSVRDEALATLERALNMNPGDTELLRSYGRVRGLAQREGRTPETVVRRLELSSLVAEADEAGSLRLAWAARGLTPDEAGTHGYRVELEAFTAAGESVPLGSGLESLRPGPDGVLALEGSSADLPVSWGLHLFLVEPRPGMYTARVRVTDLATGARAETSTGFEIPVR